MSAAVAAILVGMPEPSDLRAHQADGRVLISAGSVVLFDYAAGDTMMRDIAITVLRGLGFTGRRVAAVLGLTENYVATRHNVAVRGGTAALAGGRRGRPRKLEEAGWERAVTWRRQGVSDAEIGRRLGVAHTTVARRLGPRLAPDSELVQDAELAAEPAAGPDGQLAEAPPADPGPEAGAAGQVIAGPAIIDGVLASRYAGAMLLHAFGSQAGAGEVLAAAGLAAGTGRRRSADVALLSAASVCFALGAATVEQSLFNLLCERGQVIPA
jgi:transposase